MLCKASCATRATAGSGRWSSWPAPPRRAGCDRGQRARAERRPLQQLCRLRAGAGPPPGELHAVLSQPTDDPAFRPETVTAADLDGWADGVIEQIERAMPALRRLADGVAEDEVATAHGMWWRARRSWRSGAPPGRVGCRSAADPRARRLPPGPGAGDRRRRLPDRLRGRAGEADGAASRAIVGLRDVAGMLRSFDYAAATASSRLHSNSERTTERREMLVEQFRSRAGADFLAAYREVLEASPHPWAPRAAEHRCSTCSCWKRPPTRSVTRPPTDRTGSASRSAGSTRS